MHELAICQALMTQIEQAAADHDACIVERVIVLVGPLSGVEPHLLQRAFEVARAGSIAAHAELETITGGVRVSCHSCGAASEAIANRLLCAECGDWRVRVIQGEELMLKSLELSGTEPASRHAEMMLTQGEQ